MTSTNDGKDVKSYQTVAQKGKTYYIEFYKTLEAGLSSECDLRIRTKHLCEAWRRIHSLCQHSTSTTHPHLLSWLQRHTAKIILQTEWQSSTSKNEHRSLSEALNDFISESQEAIAARNGDITHWESQLLHRAEWFKKALLNPWGHETLKKVLDPQNGAPSDEEFLEWVKEERGIMVVTRLRQLAASKCNDLALTVATALMDRVRSDIEPQNDADQSEELREKSKTLSAEPKFADILKIQAGFTPDIWEILVDIEFVLLHKCDKRSRCIELAKQTPLRTCYQLVERLENRLENSPKEKKLWKNAREVATLIAQVTIARCMVIGACAGACRSALYWCARALTRLVAGARLVTDTVALAAPAATARHLHTLAVAVHAQSTESMKPFVCELYVRALTAGMNELERLKMKTEKEAEARAFEQTLSSWFTSLGSLLGGSPRVQCECTLTAFSVHPSPFMYEAIKKAPHLPPLHVDIQEIQEAITSEFGSWANDSRSQTNLVKTSETLNLKQQKQRSNILSTAILTEGEALGLSPELCQDIAVLLSGPRLKTLSWDMDRETLLDNCRNYMERTQGGTRALTTELKYLNLDPKAFQHLPAEDDEEENDIFYGIEKGYEHLVEFQPEEIWENATNSQELSESPYSSSLDSDCTVVKSKKKSKRVTDNFSEDSDPLSLVAQAKRKAKKKERPHSKERSKDKRIVEDPLAIHEQREHREKDKCQSKEKKKETRGRKKKDKSLAKTNPLSNLIGMKITKSIDTVDDTISLNSINDSDYESQGKFSLTSLNSEVIDEVVFDGLYSMDELKSTEIITQPYRTEHLKNNEFCVVNGEVNINRLLMDTHSFTSNASSVSSVGKITPENVDNQNKDDSKSSIQETSYLPSNINNITEEAKKRITRLIDFRRNTNNVQMMTEKNNGYGISSNNSECNKRSYNYVHPNISNSMMRKPDNKNPNYPMHADPSNYIMESANNFQNHVTPKVVTIPNIPKVFISKTPIQETGQLHIINNNNVSQSAEQLSLKNDNKKYNTQFTICNPFFNTITDAQSINNCLNQNARKENLTDPAQTTPYHTKAYHQTISPKQTDSFETPKENKFQNFLKELQKSINAGAAINNNKCLATEKETTRRVVKPISRVTPVVPSIKKIPQNAQQVPLERLNSQKKVDISLNTTFSRLSYMHKNRQNDSKLKHVVDALIEIQDMNLHKYSLPNKGLDQTISDNINAQTSFVQPKINSNKAVTFNVPCNNNTQTITTKAEKLSKIITQDMKTNPTGKSSQHNYTDVKNESQINDKVGLTSTSLSEKDQNDLLTLLRQQNKLNTVSFAKKIAATNSERNNISKSQTFCSSNYNCNKSKMDKSNTFIINKNEQVNKSTGTNSSISCIPIENKIQNCCDPINKPDKNTIKSRITGTTKVSRSLSKSSDLDQHNVKKTEINKNVNLSHNVENTTLKGTTTTDWESVMNAILAQKTPSRGPNALDVALNKSSFAKAFADSIKHNKIQEEKLKLSDKSSVATSNLKQNIKSTTKTSHSEKERGHKVSKTQKHETKRDSVTKKYAPENNVNKNKITQIPVGTTEISNTSNILNSNTSSKKTSHIGTTKRSSTNVQKQFTCPLPQEDDPFISGIANSDYDLLEELMDDDLRQEIGELSSDEDNFNMSPGDNLRKSNCEVKKHTNVLNKISDSKVITKPDIPIVQKFPETESNRTRPVSILKSDGCVENVFTSPAQAERTHINITPQPIQECSDSRESYNNQNVQECIQANNSETSSKETQINNNVNIFPTTNNNSSNLHMNSIAPQTLENLVLIEPPIAYEKFSTSQPIPQSNVNTLPVNTYVEINKTSDMSLYETMPVVPPIIDNKMISVTANQDTHINIQTIVSESRITPEIELSTQLDFTKTMKPSMSITNVDKIVLCNSKSDHDSNLDDQFNDMYYKKGQTQLNWDVNKLNDRKVLSEVQEKQHYLLDKKDQVDIKNSRVTIANDFKAACDQDRLNKKRLHIINRKVHHYSSEKPIPLTYTPLNTNVPNSVKINIKNNKNLDEFSKPQRLELLNVKIQKNKNETQSKTSKENKFEKVNHVINEFKVSKISKDHKSEHESEIFRRLLQQPSNKSHHQPVDSDLQHDNDKINGVKQKLNSSDCDKSDLDGRDLPASISKKAINELSSQSKDIINNGDSVITKKLTRKKRKIYPKKKLSSKFEQLSTNLSPIDHMDPVDIEDQILGSKIPKNEASESTKQLKSNITQDMCDNSEVCVAKNMHSIVQDIQSYNNVNKSDGQTQSAAREINDCEPICNKKIFEKTINNVTITPRIQVTQKECTSEPNEIERSRDLIDLTLENKEPAKSTLLTHTKTINKSNLQGKENLDISHKPPQTKKSDTIANRKAQNINSLGKNNYKSTVNKDYNLSAIPQSYKDSITIISLPIDSNDPLRKIVRIKLPNGRTFKATSYGKDDVDFDILFSDPSLKSVLLGGLTDKTCYTLNIKQVATTAVDNPKKIVQTRIQEINLQTKIPIGPFETIDLLSDEETDDTYQHFKTEFGDFKICSLEKCIFTSHQKKFEQKCQVKLISLNPEQHARKFNEHDISYPNNFEHNVLLPSQIEEFKNSKVATTIQNDVDIIEKGDLLNNPSNFATTNVTAEIKTLNEKVNGQTLPISNEAISIKQSILSDSNQNKLSSNETVINVDLGNKLTPSFISKYNNCYVKLVNCDDVVEKYKKLKVKHNDDVLCTHISNSNTEMHHIETLKNQDKGNAQYAYDSCKTNLHHSFQDVTVDKKLKAPISLLESGRTSPVLDAFEIISSLNNNIGKRVSIIEETPINTCVAEWLVSKPQISSRNKENQFVSEYNKDKLMLDLNICVSDWYLSKPKLSFQNKVKQYHNKQNRNSEKLVLKSLYNVPTLTAIVNKYLQMNRVWYQPKSTNAENFNLEINHSKNLKRKLSIDNNGDVGGKMTKVETTRNIPITNGEQDTYNWITGLKSQSYSDNLETESNKSFDFLNVCYDSDRESDDAASNNSESILAEQTSIFASLTSNEESDLIFNECKNELLQTQDRCEVSSKPYNIDDHGTENSCLCSEKLQYNNTTMDMLSASNIEQINLDKLVHKIDVQDLCKEMPKKIITEDHKGQNIFSKLKLIDTIENNDNNKQNQETYEVPHNELKENNETNIQDLADGPIQVNCVNNMVQLDAIPNNITSSRQESPSFSTTIFCNVAPIVLEMPECDKYKPIVKCISNFETAPELSNTHDHIFGNIINDYNVINNVNNVIQATKVTDDCSTKVLLDSEHDVEVMVLEEPCEFEGTYAEKIQLKNIVDQPKIIKENWDHEYTTLYVIPNNMSEVENSKSVTVTEEQKCDFVIEDDTILTVDKYNDTTEVIVDNYAILDEDYFEDDFILNKELSNENIVESFDEVHTKYLEEINHKDGSNLEGYNKDSDAHVSHLIDNVTNSPDTLQSVKHPIENSSCVPAYVKSTNFHKNEIETVISTKDILQCDNQILKETSEHFDVLVPNITYVKLTRNTINEKKTKRFLKRKIGMKDIKIIEKRYRKGKQIDHPKFTPNCITHTLYSKEFARLCDYFSSVKFSFSQPFHKEHIDVSEMLADWPIKDSYVKTTELETDITDVLFMDLDKFKTHDPLEQTLAEELNSAYEENKNTVCGDINENNFNMGFGEGSGRVIQNLEDGEDSKFSAATLSDVKQIQPFLLSEDYDDCIWDRNTVTIPNGPKQDDQLDKIRHYLSYIKLKDKVQAFFRKTCKEFNSITERNLKSKNDEDFNDTTIFPFGLTHPDFIEPAPVEAIVHVVQVGQLAVTAPAQNPVTCDPRVTQVSDASPPQCSENSLNDDSSTLIKTEYTELTTASLSLPLLHEYTTHNQVESQESSDMPMSNENIPIETEIKSVVKIELMEELSEEKIDQNETASNCESPESNKELLENVDYTFDTNSMNASESDPNIKNMYNSEEKDYNIVEEFVEQKQQNVSEKTDQIAHAMNAAGISTTETVSNNTAHTLVDIHPENIQTPVNNYTKALSNTMSLQQALAQILPPVVNQNGESNQSSNSTTVTPQVLHIVQGKNAPGNQITLVDNSQQSVINAPNSTPVLHFVQNKSMSTNSNPNGSIQPNTFGGLSLVDTGLQQGGNQLLQIVNTGNQKTTNTGQLLKQVNLLTNLTNVQGSNEQKMVQFLCKSADGKAIQINGPHPRSMVLRIQPVESPNMQTNTTKSQETKDSSPTSNLGNHTPNKEITSQQEIKSRSVYEENYAKFIQNSSAKQVIPEKSTSLPKFNQAFGKQGYQDGDQKQNEINGTNTHLSPLNTNNENTDCTPSENTLKLDHISQMSSPPLLLRKSPAQTTHSQSNFVQQIKQTISPINIQSMHGSVIYRQIPVNLGGGQTINLITVPNSETSEDSNHKQQSDVKFMNQNEMDQSIIKIVPQSQPTPNVEVQQQQQEENNPHININNDNSSTPQQPVLTQMRIKLPMLSKTPPQVVSGTRVVRPSFFQIQRNVIGANQQVYQQLVLTAAPPLGQQTAIRLPQTPNARQLKVPNDSPTSSESQMSSSTLEQLREFDLVLEQVKERSTVQPNGNTTVPFSQMHVTNDTTDGVIASNSVSTEPAQQVLYSIGNNQPLNMSYVSRKSSIPTATTSTYVRSPDSSGIIDSPPSSSHTQIPHTVTSDSTTMETPVHHKPTKTSKSKPRPKASSNPPNTLKLNTVPPKTSTQKPLEDEQTTQRILYILAEYKEQVENSPDKDKPAPRRRTNLPPNPGSSKRKKSSSNSRRPGGRDLSPVHGDDTCRTMGSEDSSCGTSQGDCNDCLENHSPQDSPRKVVRKLSFEQESPVNVPRQIPQRNVIVADGQTITVARGASGKPTTAVLMPANYILPVSMVKGGQQIAIVTNRGPKLLTVTSGEGGTTNALLLQRLITPAGLKPVLTRPGVRHVRLPAAALHSLQAFNLAPVSTAPPPDSTVSPAPAPTPPELVDTRANTSPWTERDSQDMKPERGSSPEGSEPWNLHAVADPNDYGYEETVRTDNLDRTVLDPIPDRYSPDMEAQRIFDKMFDVDSKRSYMIDSHADSPRCGYDIDTSDCDDKAYHQIVHKKEGTLHRQHRLTHVSAAALRHKYAILEHELRLQKSLSEECEDLGVDSPSASELFPEAELLFAASPAHDHTQDQGHQSHSHTPQPSHSCIPQPDIDDQIATDQLLPRDDLNDQQDLQLGLEDVGIVTVSEDGLQTTIALDHEEFARSHPNTTFHSEPTDDTEMQPFTITGIKGRHITSTIFHSHRPSGTVLMTAPQTTVISQAIGEGTSIPNTVKYSDIENMIDALPSVHESNLSSVLVKDDGFARFDNILTDSRELHLSNTASAIVHSTGNATQVIRRVCCDDNKRDRRDTTYLIDDSNALIAGDDAKMIAEENSRDGTLESIPGGVEDDRSSPERHTELFWESNSASERSESRRPLDYSSDSEKCCKSPFDETNSTDSCGIGTHLRLDSVIKEARGFDRSLGADCSSAEDTHPPLRTYPPKRMYHTIDGELDRSYSGKTGVGDRSPDLSEVRRRASGRGVVKRGCHCCNGSPAPPRPKKSRQKKLITDFATN